MEFTEIFVGVGVVLVAIVSLFGLTNAWNAEYGSSLGKDSEFNATNQNVQKLLEAGFINASFDYADATQAEEGAGQSSNQQDNAFLRAFRTIGLIDDLIKLIPDLIRDGAEALNVPKIYWQIAVAIFWIVFSVTLMYLLLTGARALIPGG